MGLRPWDTTKATIKVHALENKLNSFVHINGIHTTLGGGGFHRNMNTDD